MKKALFFIVIVVMMAACARVDHSHNSGVSLLSQAQLLTMTQHDGYIVATIDNPWGSGTLGTYILVPDTIAMPDSLPQGSVVRTPLRNALVYSAVHTSILAELGADACIKGITDAQYMADSAIVARLQAGEVADCGSSTNPTLEKVIEMSPDGILLSPYQENNYGCVTSLKTPLIMCADYMETSPLGRAEWIKFYGALVGKPQEADSIYNTVANTYNRLKTERAAQTATHPKVLTESMISGTWLVPGGKSYMARIIMDAGGRYPWTDDNHSGSLTLDFNQVLAAAKDADVWLVKSFNIKTYADLKSAYELHDRFDAFKHRKVYVCDTSGSHLFERFPFHPDVLLQEYCNIFDGRDTDLIFFTPCM